MAVDYIRRSITEHLAPVLSEQGFVRRAPKDFIRERGEFLDCFAFQLSQWGSKSFYVHYFVNPICDPYVDIDSSYIVGDRIHSNPDDTVGWVGDDAENADFALASVADEARKRILPWFDSFGTLEDYIRVFLKIPTRRKKSTKYLSMMVRLGRIDEFKELHAEMLQRGEEVDDHLSELAEAVESGSHSQLIEKWMSLQRERLNLCQ